MDFKMVYKLVSPATNIPSSNFTIFPVGGNEKNAVFHFLHTKITLQKRESDLGIHWKGASICTQSACIYHVGSNLEDFMIPCCELFHSYVQYVHYLLCWPIHHTSS